MALLQYQRLAEPILLASYGEAIYLDKWWQPASLPREIFKRRGVRPNPNELCAITEPTLFVTPPMPDSRGPGVMVQDRVWQYQARTFVADVPTPEVGAWMQRIEQPLTLRQPFRRNPFFQFFCGTLEQSLYVVPPYSGWHVQHPAQPPPKARAVYFQEYVKPLEISLITEPPYSGWHVQHPTRPPAPARTAYFQEQVKPLDPSVTTPESITVDKWYAEHPTRPPARNITTSLIQSFDKTVEPTLYDPAPSMSTWYVQHPRRPIPPWTRDWAPAFLYQAEPSVYPAEQLTLDKWYVEHPARPPERPRAAYFQPYEKTAEPTLYTTPLMSTWYVERFNPPHHQIPRRTAWFQDFVRVPVPDVTAPGDVQHVIVSGEAFVTYVVTGSDEATYIVTGSDSVDG